MGTSIGLWLVSLSIVVGVAWHATGDVLDDALEEGARLVLMLDPQEASAGATTTGTRLNRDDALKLRMYYQLVAADGRVLLRGDDTPETAFLPQAHSKQTTTVWVDDELWRVYVRPGSGGVTAQVAQPMEERLELLEDMAENLARIGAAGAARPIKLALDTTPDAAVRRHGQADQLQITR
jgi:two-component system sensor histidine kinase QseC